MSYFYSFAFTFTFFCIATTSAWTQGTYPVFPNLLDHSVTGDAQFLGAQGDRLIYIDKVNDQNRLWVSNGTPEGTFQPDPSQVDVRLIHKSDDAWYFSEQKGGSFHISKLEVGGDTLVIVHSSGIRYLDVLYWNGKFAWIQRSASSSYDRVQLYDPSTASLLTLVDMGYLNIRSIGSTNEELFYIASTNDGKMLGKSDGTIENTSLFAELYPAGSSFDGQTRFFSNGEKIFFFYHPLNEPYTLWTTDGTSAGTQSLGVYDNPLFGWEDNPAIFLGNTLFFILREADAPSGTTLELHASDGTPEGTYTLDDSPDDYMQPADLTLFNNKVYFISQLYGSSDMRASDGTPAGTTLILDAFGHENGGVGGIIELGTYDNNLVIQAYTEELGSELYSNNGTSQGTTLIADVIHGTSFSKYNHFIQVGDRLFFTVNYANRGRLWIYDPAYGISCDSFSITEIITHISDTTPTGSIEVHPSGGQQPITYQLDNGATTGTSSFTNLGEGEHTVVVTDNLGCSITLEFIIEETTSIIEPGLLSHFYVAPNPSIADVGFTVNLNMTQSNKHKFISFILHGINGEVVSEEKMNISSSEIHHHISTGGLLSGAYILLVMLDHQPAGRMQLVLQK